MHIKVKYLRKIIRERLIEWAGASPTKPMFDYVNNPMSPSKVDREQLSSLANANVDIDEDEGLPSHLIEPDTDMKDCYGPVPPTENEPWVTQDPFARQTSPLPTKPM